ncbi:glutathione peroxidase 1-like [Lepus europaeus]|uniref:glutathione peroxidase 1-like n=1 Tax=Lepus europaeus TaxID=9983 RepID=UPI002B48DC05|nr:glutathione peroxidase 1-like [Lepus europaeus]
MTLGRRVLAFTLEIKACGDIETESNHHLGGGFEPNFMLFQKCEVNGAKAHPLFAFLREALLAPSDDPTALMTDPKFITWSLVCRNDVSWNFEKFLVGPDGVPVRRYSRRFPTIDIEPDIQALLSKVSGGA